MAGIDLVVNTHLHFDHCLIDLVPHPVNPTDDAERRANVGNCVARTQDLDPEGIIVCHSEVFNVLKQPMLEAGLSLPHDEPIPFSLGSWRPTFVERHRQAVQRLESND
ncbi:hypothetical protein V6N00_04680 [Tersicoccus sp. MR15.9]|uniref:hypothetical protein n=1 Tax=Tersicoccus mangrovi TaxID=3121635 RepID=UPI002FE5C3F9